MAKINMRWLTILKHVLMENFFDKVVLKRKLRFIFMIASYIGVDLDRFFIIESGAVVFRQNASVEGVPYKCSFLEGIDRDLIKGLLPLFFYFLFFVDFDPCRDKFTEKNISEFLGKYTYFLPLSNFILFLVKVCNLEKRDAFRIIYGAIDNMSSEDFEELAVRLPMPILLEALFMKYLDLHDILEFVLNEFLSLEDVRRVISGLSSHILLLRKIIEKRISREEVSQDCLSLVVNYNFMWLMKKIDSSRISSKRMDPMYRRFYSDYNLAFGPDYSSNKSRYIEHETQEYLEEIELEIGKSRGYLKSLIGSSLLLFAIGLLSTFVQSLIIVFISFSLSGIIYRYWGKIVLHTKRVLELAIDALPKKVYNNIYQAFYGLSPRDLGVIRHSLFLQARAMFDEPQEIETLDNISSSILEKIFAMLDTEKIERIKDFETKFRNLRIDSFRYDVESLVLMMPLAIMFIMFFIPFWFPIYMIVDFTFFYWWIISSILLVDIILLSGTTRLLRLQEDIANKLQQDN